MKYWLFFLSLNLIHCTFDTVGLHKAGTRDSIPQWDTLLADEGIGPGPSDGGIPDHDRMVQVEDSFSPPDLVIPPDIIFDTDATGCNANECPLGCHDTQPRCAELWPSNFDPWPFYSKSIVQLKFKDGDTVTVNGETGEIKGEKIDYRTTENDNNIVWQIVNQSSDIPLAVFGVHSLEISANTKVKIIGAHPVAWYVQTSASISGTIDLSANYAQPGPGGRSGGLKNGEPGESCNGGEGKGGNQGGSGNYETEAGGGGGGWGQAGGNGGIPGCKGSWVGGGTGGGIAGNDTLIPLQGGCGGGAGGGPDTQGNSGRGGDGGSGGGGGGALQISAGVSIAVNKDAWISAAGGGGEGGHYGGGGGAGGSGGSIFLESPTIYVEGLLAANGGSGGAGGVNLSTKDAAKGKDGNASFTPAAPGAAKDWGGAGGSGSALCCLAENGQGGETFCNGGGGGGGVGRIRINGININIAPSTPMATFTNSLKTW